MKDLLYVENGKFKASTFLEICVPMDYFDDGYAVDQGIVVQTFGLLFIRGVDGNSNGPIKLINLPTTVMLNVYDSKEGEIVIHGKTVKVMIYRYLKDAFVMNATVIQGRTEAETFLNMIIGGKLPKVLSYSKLADIWWRNLEIAGVDLNVPSKIYELTLATIYRDPNNTRRRYGEKYGKQQPPDEYGYQTGNVREVVANLSTFSGIIFEDINKMITSGINNSLEGVEEEVSPLEKIIYL